MVGSSNASYMRYRAELRNVCFRGKAGIPIALRMSANDRKRHCLNISAAVCTENLIRIE
jgi:hypothetical protein